MKRHGDLDDAVGIGRVVILTMIGIPILIAAGSFLAGWFAP